MSERGRFITFEGIDGAGKSTHIETVADVLRERGIPFVATREPGGTRLGEQLRGLILAKPMTPMTETLLMFAARSEHVARIIQPALRAGQWVLCDRFTDATYAYQAGGRGLDPGFIAVLEQWVHPDLQPDLTLLFDVPAEVAEERRKQAREADRFESEHANFFASVRSHYLLRAGHDPKRFFVVDGTRSVEVVRSQLTELMQRWDG